MASSADGNKVVAVVWGGQIYTSAILFTTTGLAGSIAGGQYDAVELLYIGNNTFMILSHQGSVTAL